MQNFKYYGSHDWGPQKSSLVLGITQSNKAQLAARYVELDNLFITLNLWKSRIELLSLEREIAPLCLVWRSNFEATPAKWPSKLVSAVVCRPLFRPLRPLPHAVQFLVTLASVSQPPNLPASNLLTLLPMCLFEIFDPICCPN